MACLDLTVSISDHLIYQILLPVATDSFHGQHSHTRRRGSLEGATVMRVTTVLLVHQEMGRDVGSGASVGSGVSIGVSVGAGDSVKTGDSVGTIVSVSIRVSVADGISMGVAAAEVEDRGKLESGVWVGVRLGIDTTLELVVGSCI